MRKAWWRGAFWIGVLSAPLSAAEVDFAHDVVPVLRKYCAECHAGAKQQGRFSFNTREQLLAGGESGPAIAPGKGGASALIARITSADPDVQMPPKGPRVPAEQVAVLQRWIDAGAPWEAGFTFQPAAYEPPLKPRRPDLPPPRDGRSHPVDRLIDAYFAERDLPRPAPLDDAAFARRVHLDLIGLLPEPAALAEFLRDARPDKRARLVDDLLARDVDYAEHWLTFWNDLLRNDYTGTGFITGGRKQITKWLYRALVDNLPYDAFVRGLIAPSPESEGYIQGIRWRGDVSASQTQEIQFAQSISQSFLGINMKCASCHDSFIDRWKLTDAYQLAAIYSTRPLEIYRCDKPTGATAVAGWIFPDLGQIDPQAPQPQRLARLAELMTHPDNGRFTRTIVNRLWHRLMGRGIVHPVDAMHTPPWHADLLDYLAVHFQDEGYNLRATLKLICTSAAYQSQAVVLEQSLEGQPFVYRGPLAKRMTAEQFVDAVWQLTESAPLRYDAPVLRGKIGAGAADASELRAQWIWAYADADRSPGGETVTFRYRWTVKDPPQQGAAVITCDNAYTLFLNGQKVQADENWETVEAVALAPHLKAGANDFVIVAKNGGAGPNPAGLIFEARVRLADGTEATVATGADWEWTKAAPNPNNGRFAKDPGDWRPATPVKNPGVWSGRVGGDLRSLLSQAASGSTRMVRASLVKSDSLMRTLGRPNRDQIVTMRPDELTTLEAIDLANGEILAETLDRGVVRVLAKSWSSADALVDWLYQAALSRPPTAAEAEAARGWLSAGLQPDAVEDLIWSVLMLPEFQLVR